MRLKQKRTACLAVAMALLGAALLHAQQPAQTPGTTQADEPTLAPRNTGGAMNAAPPPVGLAAAQGQAVTAPQAMSPAPMPDPALTVPSGTKVLLALESPINTRTTKAGDGVYLVSTFPVIVGTHVLVPSGVYVQGVIDQVERAGHIKGRAKLLMHFTTMIFPNGQVVTIPGGVNNLPGSDGAAVNSEGRIEQPSNKGKDAATIAKGAAIGAGGGVIGGGSVGHPIAGAAYGGAAGAVGGLIYTMFERGADIQIQKGASVEMVLQRPLQLEAAQLEGINDLTGRPQFQPSSRQQQPLPKHVQVTCPQGSLGCS